VVGALTVERIVNGQYEWRDAGYAALKGTRKNGYGTRATRSETDTRDATLTTDAWSARKAKYPTSRAALLLHPPLDAQ